MLKPEILNDEEVNKAWDGAFDKPINFDHKPIAEEIFTIRLKAVAQVQRDNDSEYYETIIEENKKETLEQIKEMVIDLANPFVGYIDVVENIRMAKEQGFERFRQILQSQLEEARGK